MSLERSSPRETQRSGGLARFLTALFMLLTVLVFACYVAVFINPQLPFNPFKPPTVPTVAPSGLAEAEAATAVPTFTPPLTYPPTWTPTLTPIPTETFTPRPTSTPKPTSTPRPLTSTPVPPPAFSLRTDPIFTRQNLYSGVGGWWTGLAGEVSDQEGNAVTDVTVKIWDNKGHVWEVRPGGAADYMDAYGTAYGSGGSYAWWEQVLDGSCQQSITVHVQVIRDGQASSPEVTVETTGDCDRNLVLIHFVKNW